MAINDETPRPPKGAKCPEDFLRIIRPNSPNPFADLSDEQLEALVFLFPDIEAGRYDRWIASGCYGPPIPDDQWPR
ncbi:hypothetical protein [Sulfobacillus thermosulfidooxidans]|uniref:hypothetical protein n=1 Tax=Sulfobacillus thermosulfidooxidans TaxID=28034 RepID=UPI0006B46305|nr:hypothetical protein [Sulfobacillus thermosulfidooxidans]